MPPRCAHIANMIPIRYLGTNVIRYHIYSVYFKGDKTKFSKKILKSLISELTSLLLKCENRDLQLKYPRLAVENSLLAENVNFSNGVKICIYEYANHS